MRGRGRPLRRMLAVLGAGLSALFGTGAAAFNEEVFSDGIYFVYRETTSCALYADYPEDTMLRVAYRPSSKTVFFAVVGPKWARRVKEGEAHTVRIGLTDRPGWAIGLPVLGFRQPSPDDGRIGVSGGHSIELLRRLQASQTVSVTLLGEEVERLPINGIRPAIEKLIACGEAHFG